MSAQSTPRHGHAPIPMRRVDGFASSERVGDFWWNFDPDGTRRIFMQIPSCDGEPEPIQVPVSRERQPGKAWGWDGNEDKPTLTPSVHTLGHWHGWVRHGELVEA